MTKTSKVNNLSEYIAAIEENNLYHYISRGENRKYENPLCSGIHRAQFDEYKRMLEEYHFEVEPNLSQIQEHNFLAFCQHHGMPTNLLDFSFSPLVSLYFSTDAFEETGYVYFIPKSRTVQIHKLLSKKAYGWGLFDDLLDYNHEVISELLPEMTEAFMSNRLFMIDYFEKHLDALIKKHKNIRVIGEDYSRTDDIEFALNKYKRDKVLWDKKYGETEPHTLQIYDSAPNFLKGFQKLYKDFLISPDHFIENYCHYKDKGFSGPLGSINVTLLLFMLKYEEVDYRFRLTKPENASDYIKEIEFPFYFTYRPPVIDERIRNQQSIFVFQPFTTSGMHNRPKHIQFWQAIKPEYVIEVADPQKIRKELDAIGINLKSIYCDYDSVAKYIRNCY